MLQETQQIEGKSDVKNERSVSVKEPVEGQIPNQHQGSDRTFVIVILGLIIGGLITGFVFATMSVIDFKNKDDMRISQISMTGKCIKVFPPNGNLYPVAWLLPNQELCILVDFILPIPTLNSLRIIYINKLKECSYFRADPDNQGIWGRGFGMAVYGIVIICFISCMVGAICKDIEDREEYAQKEEQRQARLREVELRGIRIDVG